MTRLLPTSVTLVAVVYILAGSAVADEFSANEPPQPRREFRAAWIATVANIDWPSRPGLPSDRQQAELVSLLDTAVRLHLNAVILQVRPACDALYPSELEPWSEFLTGRMGKPPQPVYDPLDFAVREAHARGLELHAWFNPYRALHPASKKPVADNHVSRTHSQFVREYGEYLWLDPGAPGAVDHTVAVIMDVVSRYDIDGVHIDDYFYPYPIREGDENEEDADRAEPSKSRKKVPFPDDATWQQALSLVDEQVRPLINRDDWRRQNVDRLVERVYREIKAAKPWVKFGVSPFGIWRPGYPPQIKGFDQYAEIYADARKWLEEGWLDYFTPQLYWRIDPPEQSYAALLSWWHKQNKLKRHLWPGSFTSRLRQQRDETRWPAEEIVAQIWVTRAQAGASGNVHFNIKALAENAGGIADMLIAGPYREPALVPESPWLPPRPGSEVGDIRDRPGATTGRNQTVNRR